MKFRYLNYRASLTAIGFALAATSFAAPAHAQTAPVAEDAVSDDANIMIVTAEKGSKICKKCLWPRQFQRGDQGRRWPIRSVVVRQQRL